MREFGAEPARPGLSRADSGLAYQCRSVMRDIQLRRFISKYVQSAAYHEAGHATVAALQGMPLQQGGIHVDSEGSGVSYYWHRSPGSPASVVRRN